MRVSVLLYLINARNFVPSKNLNDETDDDLKTSNHGHTSGWLQFQRSYWNCNKNKLLLFLNIFRGCFSGTFRSKHWRNLITLCCFTCCIPAICLCVWTIKNTLYKYWSSLRNQLWILGLFTLLLSRLSFKICKNWSSPMRQTCWATPSRATMTAIIQG